MPATRAPLVLLAAFGLAGSVPAPAEAAGNQNGEPRTHHFGDAARPLVALAFEELETPGGPCHLELVVSAANGIETQAATSTPAPPATCRRTAAGQDVTGRSRLEGRELPYRARLGSDGRVLDWISPESVTLRNGSVHVLAGRYTRLDEPTRVASARASFDAVDRELNAVYRRLLAARPPELVSALRADQRRWLKYRDFTLFDGDDAEAVGPGTSAHLREQGRRTLARVRFLTSLLDPPRTDVGETLFSDGRSGTVAVRRIGDALAFSAVVEVPRLNAPGAPGDVPCRLSGVARPSGPLAWEAHPEAMAVSDKTWTPERLLLSLDGDGRLRIAAAGPQAGMLARVLAGEYAPLRRLTPAEAPLRSLVQELPAQAFDDTTDGLQGAERQSLLVTGSGGSFRIGTETPDHLYLRYPGGHVRIARFPGADGGAVLAVEQANGRNLSVQLWRQTAAREPLVPWEDALPAIPAGDFFASGADKEGAWATAKGRPVTLLDDSGALRQSLQAHEGGAEPDYAFVLAWDGFGFVAERTSLALRSRR